MNKKEGASCITTHLLFFKTAKITKRIEYREHVHPFEGLLQYQFYETIFYWEYRDKNTYFTKPAKRRKESSELTKYAAFKR